jgi:hypothetical protein
LYRRFHPNTLRQPAHGCGHQPGWFSRPRDHGLLFNGTLVRTDNPLSVNVDPNIAKDRMVHVETLYDIAHNHGLTTAQVNWVAINDAATINWAFPEKASPSDPLVAEMISKGVINAEDVGNNGKPSILWRDQIWTKAGAYIIREHKPNLIVISSAFARFHSSRSRPANAGEPRRNRVPR